jgi:glycosyltransferase involved in cell wall biosynthesis
MDRRSIKTGLLFAKKTAPGIVGQSLAVIAVALPIVAGMIEEISAQIFVSAIATILVTSAVLAFPSVYPSIKNTQDASTCFQASLLTLITSTLLAGVLGCAVLFMVPYIDFAMYFVAGIALFFLQGLSLLATGLLTRENMPEVVSRSRLIFGVVSFLGTALVCAYPVVKSGLIWVAALSFALNAAFSFWSFRNRLRSKQIEFESIRFNSSVIKYIRDALPNSFEAFVNNIAGQAPNLAIPLVGPLSAFWALGAKVTSGFATIAIQLVNPWIESGYAVGVRNGDVGQVKKYMRYALMWSVAFASLNSIAIFLAIFALGLLPDNNSTHLALIVFSTISLWACSAALVPISRLLMLGNGLRQQRIWTFCRLALTIVCFLLFNQEQLIVSLSLITSFFTAFFITSLLRTNQVRTVADLADIKILEVVRSLNLGGAQKLLLTRLSSDAPISSNTILFNTHPGELGMLQEFQKANINVVTSSSSGILNSSLSLLRFIKVQKPDVLVFHSPSAALLFKFLRMVRLLKTPIVEVGHSTNYKSKIINGLSTLLNPGLDLFLPVSKAVEQSKRSKFARKVLVCYHGVAIDEMTGWISTHKSEIKLQRERMNMGIQEPLRALFCGRLDTQKGVSYLVPIMKKLKGYPITLTVVGDGELYSWLDSTMKSNGLEDQVLLLGAQPDAWKFMPAADLLLAPSVTEGLGVVVMEAMVAGLPVVASDLPSLREIIVDNQNGHLVPVGDIHEFANKLLALLKNSTQISRMSDSALSHSKLWDAKSNEQVFYNAVLMSVSLKK